MTLEVGYIGRRGRDLLMQMDAPAAGRIHFKDPASGQTWNEMSSAMRDHHNAGLDPAAGAREPGLRCR